MAPDLALTAIQISSPTSLRRISDTLQFRSKTQPGDLRVGPGVVIEFFGAWDEPSSRKRSENAQGDTLTYVLEVSLEPELATVLSVDTSADATIVKTYRRPSPPASTGGAGP